jgi:hypothetical protein
MLYYKLWLMKGLAMKKLLFLLLCGALLALPAQKAGAQFASFGAEARPKIASEQEIALLYYRLTQQMPDFSAWARASDEYRKALPIDRETVEAQKVAELKTAYNLLSFSDPVVVRLRVHLSAYSPKNKGYVVNNIEEQTFFKFKYAGQNYAIVPRGLMDHQFLGPMPDDSYDTAISRHRAIGSSYNLMIFLKPDWADQPDTLTEIDGESFHLISGPISHVALFDVNETVQLWASESKIAGGEQSQELLNLKQ